MDRLGHVSYAPVAVDYTMPSPSLDVAVNRGEDRLVDRQPGMIEARVGGRVNLKELFPTTPLFAVRVNFSWIVATLCAGALYIWAIYVQQIFLPGSPVATKSLFLVGILALVSALKLLHSELYRRSLRYEIHDFRLMITRGVLFRRAGSVPISMFGEAYVRQDLLDRILGVYEFQLLLPMDPTKEFARLEALSGPSARGLQSFITEFVSKQLFVPAEPVRISVPLPRALPAAAS